VSPQQRGQAPPALPISTGRKLRNATLPEERFDIPKNAIFRKEKRAKI
jgi:hypothetical protein